MPNTTTKVILDQIPMLPQRQDAVNDQLFDLAQVATKLGMYDAASLISDVLDRRNGKDVCCNHKR